MGHIRTLPADGGGHPSAIFHRLILDPKTAFDSPGPQLPEYTAKFYLKVADDATGQIKGQIFLTSPLTSLVKAAKPD